MNDLVKQSIDARKMGFTNSYIIKSKDINSLLKYFSKKFTVLNFDNYIMVIAPRRMQKSILNFVKSVDEKALIICEKVKFF